VPVDLAHDSYTLVDSGMGMEKFSISNDSTCGNQVLEDDSAASVTSVVSNNESIASVSHGEPFVNLSDTNTELVSETQISDNCDSVMCQANYDSNCNKTNTGPTASEICYSEKTVEDAIDCKDVCCSLLQDQSPDLAYKDSDDVDMCRLGSVLWPKSTFATDAATDYSFAALTAEHENFCKDHLEDVTRQKTVLSGSGETETSSMQGIHRAEWPTVSRWLQESKLKFIKQFPQCSALMRGLPVSDTDPKLHIDSDTLSQNMAICTDSTLTANSTPFSSEVNDELAPSWDSRITDVTNDVNGAGLGSIPNCSKQLPSAVSLSREKILSLQFSRVPLSPQVISRIKEMRLRCTGDVLRPADCKWSTRNKPLSKHLEPNLSGGTMLPSASVPTEIPANSVSMKDNGQSMNRSAVKSDAVSAVSTASRAGCRTLQDPHEASLEQAPANYESHISTSVPAQSVVSGLTQAVLYSHSMPQSSKSIKAPIMSHLSPVSDTRAATAVADVTSYKVQPIDKLSSTVEVMHEGTFRISSTDVMQLSNSALLPTSSVSNSTVNTTASAFPKSAQSITVSELSPQAASLAIGERRPDKKCNTKVAEISETLPDHNYHKEFETLPGTSYHNDFVSVPIQQHIPQTEHSVSNKNPHGETNRRYRRSRQGSRFPEAAAFSPIEGVSDSQSQSKFQYAKCSRCRNANSSADPTSNKAHHSKQSRASKLQTPYMFDHYGAYSSWYMPNMTPSVLASVSYYSYYLGAYDAHVRSMHYYNTLSHQAAATMWQQQADYIHRLAKFYAHS